MVGPFLIDMNTPLTVEVTFFTKKLGTYMHLSENMGLIVSKIGAI